MTRNFGGMSLFGKFQSLTFRYVELIQLVEQSVLEMVVDPIITFFFTNLALELLKYVLEVSSLVCSTLYSLWVKGSMCIGVSKSTIVDVHGLESMFATLLVLPFLFLMIR